MEWVTDSELKQLLASAQPPIANVNLDCDLNSIDSQIQPCSVDLRIDEIFLPLARGANVNAVPRTYQHALKVGESVKVSTIERFELSDEFAGILFAPARLSRRGIVVPDIGHIDPGFNGQLRMTLINMGRDSYALNTKETVATALLFRLSHKCAVGLSERRGPQPYARGLDDIRHLAPDFLNIKGLAKETARKEARRVLAKSGWRFAFMYVFLPIIVTLLLAGAAYYFGEVREQEAFEINTKAQVESLEKALQVDRATSQLQADLDKRLAAMQRQIDEVRTATFRKTETKPSNK